MSKDTRFVHLRGDKLDTQSGAVTIAYSKGEHSTIAFGVSYCSPHDHYNRKRGNTIAQGRMAKPHSRHNITKLPHETCGDTIRAMIHMVLHSHETPRWAKRVFSMHAVTR